MLDIQTLSITIAAVSVVAGVIYYSFQLRNQSKTRQTDLLMRLYSTFGSKEFQEKYTKILNLEFKDCEDSVKRHQWVEAIPVLTFFEGIGVLLHRKLVDIGLVDDLFRQSIKLIWEKTKPIVEYARKQYDQPQWAGYFEYLYNETQKRQQQIKQ